MITFGAAEPDIFGREIGADALMVPTVATVWISLNKWRAQGDPMIFVGAKEVRATLQTDVPSEIVRALHNLREASLIEPGTGDSDEPTVPGSISQGRRKTVPTRRG